MNNNHRRYINILTIIILDCEFSFKIGNPIWFIQEFRNIRSNT